MSRISEIDDKIVKFTGAYRAAETREEAQQIATGPLYWLTRIRAELLSLPLRGRVSREMHTLVREFYKADPFNADRQKIVADLQGIAEAGIVSQKINLARIPERRERITREFSLQTQPSRYGCREADIDRESKILLGEVVKGELKGVARAVVEDRLHTLSAERAYRLMPRGRIFGRQRYERDRANVLESVLKPSV